MMDVKDWYRSRTVWGAVVAVVASCARLAGLEIAAADQQQAIEALTTIAAAAGGLIAIYGRFSAHKRLR